MGRPVLELRGVSRRYLGAPPVDALRRTDLVVWPSDFVVIRGPSGSGKSTLLNLVGLMDRPTGGEIFVEGEAVGSLSERERTKIRGSRIGFVFQSFELLPHRSALENVTLPLVYQGAPRERQHESAHRSLDVVGLATRALSMPSQLSGGERQRVAIARALCAGPAILLCDEPTGNLDSESSQAVMTTLEDLNRSGTTVMMITHNPDLQPGRGRLLFMRDGVLSEG